MQIWVDADACPKPVKEILYRAAHKRQITMILVANQFMAAPVSPYIKSIQVSSGFDVADNYIVQELIAGDVLITADIPLAALLVPKGVVVIDPRGDVYTEESIGERLSVRNFMDDLRMGGVDTGGHASYGAKDKQAFANAIDRALTRALRKGL